MNLRYGHILNMALPLMLGQFVQSIVAITDMALVGRVSQEAFGAVGNASLYHMALFMLGLGIADGAQIRFSRFYAREEYHRIGSEFRHGWLMMMAVAFLLLIGIQFVAPVLLEAVVSNDRITTGIETYLSYRSPGFFFEFTRLMLIALYVSRGRSRVVIYSATVMALVNIVLDLILINGNLGFPALGVKGAAIASMSAEFSGMAYLVIYALRDPDVKQFDLLSRMRPQWVMFREIARTSIPLMVQGLLAMVAWNIFFTMVEHMGADELEVSQIVRNVYMLAIIPIHGLGAVTKIYVSYYMGKVRFRLVKASIVRIVTLDVLLTGTIALLILLFPEQITRLFRGNTSVMDDAVFVLRFVSGVIVLFGAASILFQAVSGTGHTRVSMGIEITSILIYLVAAWLVIQQLELGIRQIWVVEYVYFTIMGLGALVYLATGKWKRSNI